MVCSFREALEIPFRFSKKRVNLTVNVANPASGRGRAMCPSATLGGSSEVLVLQPFFSQCLEGVALHSSYGNTVTLMVGVWDWPKGTRCLFLTFACCLVTVTYACTPWVELCALSIYPGLGDGKTSPEIRKPATWWQPFPRMGLRWILKQSGGSSPCRRPAPETEGVNASNGPVRFD